jgi:predicted transcriptional regulator
MEIKLLSFVLRSKTRQEILALLSKETLTPSQIMKRTEMYESHVSRALKELLGNGLVECENPKERRFRFYRITNLGKEVLKQAEKITNEIKK